MKIKKLVISTACLAAAALSATAVLSSCSSVSKEIRDNLTDRGDGLMLSNNVSLEDTIKNALSDESGSNAYLDNFANVLIAQWFQDKKDKFEDIKEFLDDTEDEIKDDYNDQIKSYKDSHKGDWKYHFQNEVLNPVGGTKEAWFNSKRYEKYRTKLSEYAFKTAALGVPQNGDQDDGSSVLQVGQKNGSYSFLTNSANWPKINFFANVFNPNFKDTGNEDKKPVVSRDLADQFALIQKMTCEALLKNKHPISVAMALWKYSEPTDGLDTIYAKPNTTEEDNTDPDNPDNPQTADDDNNTDPDNPDDDNKTIVTKASYEYPYFKKADNPLKISAQRKYQNLLDALKQNTGKNWDSLITEADGLFNLAFDGSSGSDINYTEDSSTLMGVNLSSQFDELDTYFAGTVAQAVNELLNATSANNSSFSFLPDGFKTNSVLNRVDIMENFMYRSGDPSVTGANSTIKNYIDLNDVYGTKDSFTNAVDFHSPVFNDKSDYYKSSNGLGGVRYVINTVRVDQSVGSSVIPIYLVRDTFGVHFIAIDGYNYIKSKVNAAGTNELDKQKALLNASADVIKYRTIASGNAWYVSTDSNDGASGVSTTFSNDSLKSYFDSNMSKIVLAIWNEGKDTNSEYNRIFKDFSYNWDGNDGDVDANKTYDMLTTIMELVDTQQKISSYESVNKKLLEISNKYTPNAFLSNINANNPTKIVDSYEIDILYQNGLASPLEYEILNVSPSEFLSYDISETVIFGNEHLIHPSGLNTDKFSITIKTLISSVQTSVGEWFNENKDHIKPSFSGDYNEWSETIYTTHTGVNIALQAYGSSGNKLSNPEKVATYTAYIDQLQTNTVFNGILDFDNGEFWTSTDPEKLAAKNAFISTYILPSVISSSQPIWYYLKNPISGTNAQAVNQEYQNLILNTWKQKNFQFINGLVDYSDDYVSFLSTVSTILWFSVDNDTVKSKDQLDGNQNDGRLIDQLAVTVEKNKAAYICWLSQSNLAFDASFASPASLSDSFDMSKNTNPNGVFNNLYQNTSNQFIKATSFGDNANWWNYATTKINNQTIPMNGYLGLQTSNSSSLPSKVNNALFTNLGDYIDQTTNVKKGLLFKYGSLEELIESIDQLGSINDLDALVEDLAKSSNDFAMSDEYTRIKNRLINGDEGLKTGGLKELSEELKKYVERNFKDSNYYERITDSNSYGAILTNYTNGRKTYVTEVGSDDYEYAYRTFFIPVRFDDFDVKKHASNTNDMPAAYRDVKNNLIQNIFGSNVYYSIFIQTAMTSSNSDRALAEIIKWVNGDDKITIHDKRMYDQLGKEWTSKWRTN